jgi:hypothetical protein
MKTKFFPYMMYMLTIVSNNKYEFKNAVYKHVFGLKKFQIYFMINNEIFNKRFLLYLEDK